MPKGEFENRDRDESSGLAGIPLSGSLGELPEDLSNERRDLDSYALRAAENMSPDMARASQGRIAEQKTGLGSPAMDYNVRSVYDSRPPSGKDFNLWFYTSTPACGTEDFSGFARCWQVPSGYVAVVRRIKILLDPTTSVGFPYHGTLRVLVNGASLDPESMVVGQGNANSVPVQLNGIPFRDGDDGCETFVVADEFQFVGVDFPTYSPGSLIQPYVGFYGNFLLKTGRPAMFEPANFAGRALTAVTSSAADLGNIASGSDVVARKRHKVPFPNVPILRK